jgi:hypothetical protein
MDDPNRDAKIEHISKWSASTSSANTKHVPFLATGRTMAPQSLLGELAEGGDGAHRLDLEEEPPRPAILPLVQEMRERERPHLRRLRLQVEWRLIPSSSPPLLHFALLPPRHCPHAAALLVPLSALLATVLDLLLVLAPSQVGRLSWGTPQCVSSGGWIPSMGRRWEFIFSGE